MTDREVTGSASALAYLFSGGHAMQVSTGRTREQRIAHRAALRETWSRAIMARLPHPLATARREYQKAHPLARGVKVTKSLKVLRKLAVRP